MEITPIPPPVQPCIEHLEIIYDHLFSLLKFDLIVIIIVLLIYLFSYLVLPYTKYITITLNLVKTSPLVWEIPPRRTTSFSLFMLTIADPYLNKRIQHNMKTVEFLTPCLAHVWSFGPVWMVKRLYQINVRY